MAECNNIENITSPAEGDWVKYWECSIAEEGDLSLSDQYAVLIVISGKIELTFKKHTNEIVLDKSLIVIDRQQLTHFKWDAGTAILQYTPPVKIFRFFRSCSSAFNMPCSAIVPVHPKLQKWIDDLMVERLQPQEMLTDIRRREYCVRLGNILRSYPPLQVGELLVPFHACSLSGEKKCKGELCM